MSKEPTKRTEYSCNTCIWGYVIMAKKCKYCGSSNTEVLINSEKGAGGTIFRGLQGGKKFYQCNNCGKAWVG